MLAGVWSVYLLERAAAAEWVEAERLETLAEHCASYPEPPGVHEHLTRRLQGRAERCRDRARRVWVVVEALRAASGRFALPPPRRAP